MRPDKHRQEEAELWLRDAQSDLALASVKKTQNMRYAHLCFHAQQTAEKSLKAILIIIGHPVPRTHDLSFLLDQLPTTLPLPIELIALPVLTKFAVLCRYPGQDEIPISSRDHRQAVALAEATIRWAAQVALKAFDHKK